MSRKKISNWPTGVWDGMGQQKGYLTTRPKRLYIQTLSPNEAIHTTAEIHD